MQEMQESWARFLGLRKNLEEEPAAHSRILAWEIPWTEEPGMLQSMGLQRTGHNLATEPHRANIYENDLKISRKDLSQLKT